MGRKFTVPYAVYRAHGFVNPYLAAQTGFSETDLELLWEALVNAFQFDQSAARPAGSLAARKLVIFKHPNELGVMPSQHLLDTVSIRRNDRVKSPRQFEDYTVSIDRSRLHPEVEASERP